MVLFALNVSAASILPTDRSARWDLAGVPGGIPARTVYTNLSPAGVAATDEASINLAIANCPSNQVVSLGAGTFVTSNSIAIKQGITLRGAGMANTIVRNPYGNPFTIFSSYNYDWDVGGQASNRVFVNGGIAQNATNLNLAATNWNNTTTTVPISRLVFLDQLNDTNTTAVGQYGINGGAYTSRAQPNTGSDRYQHSIHHVVSTSGTNITVWPPLTFANWTQSLSPTIWWESSNPVELSGVEDLWIQNTNSGTGGIVMDNVYGCWAKNVKVTGCRYPIRTLNLAVNCEIRGCWIEGQSGSTDDYDLAPAQFCFGLTTDNVFFSVDNGMVLTATIASVFSYNYITNVLPFNTANLRGNFWTHGGNCANNLLEGNILNGALMLENGWGSSPGNVVFRNFIAGWDFNGAYAGGQAYAIMVNATNRLTSIIGNVLGTTSKNFDYQLTGTETVQQWSLVYWLGYFTQFGASTVDPPTWLTMIRHLNNTSATNTVAPAGFNVAITNSIDYQNGFDANVANLDQSLYLSSAPTNFGILTWPPVTPSNRAYSTSQTNIPAGYRFAFGTNPPPSVTSLIYYPASPRNRGFQ